MKPKASRLLAASQIILCLTALPAMALVYDWDGSLNGDWNLNTNWAPDGLPTTTDNVLVTVDGAVTKTITLSATPTNSTILEVGLARTGNGTATVNHTGGELTVTGWFNLGQGFAGTGDRNGTGIWNMSGSAKVNATHASGLTTIAAGFTPTGYNTGILSITDNAWFNQTAAAIHVGGEGAGNRAKGIINLSGSGKLTNTSTLNVGVAANGSTGVVNVAGTSTLTADRFLLGINNGAVGAINQSGGTVSTTSLLARSLSLGHVTGGFGSYRISAGSLATTEIALGGETVGSGGSGILDISGSGAVSTNPGGWVVLNRTDGTGAVAQSAVLNVSGGSLTYDGGGLVANWGSSTTTGQTSVINVSGTGSIVTRNNSPIELGRGTGVNNVGMLNLNGGTVTPSRIFGNRSFVNFNGGTLRANSAQADFVAVTNAQVRAGGAVIDSNGFNITIGQALLAPSDSGVTTIAVTNGGSGYVSAPILSISGGSGSGATAIANMVDDETGNGTFKIGSITVTGAGNYTAAPGSITAFGGAPITAATFGTIATAANVSGGLTKNGLGTLTLSGANTFTGAVNVTNGTLNVTTGGQIVTGSTMTVGNAATSATATVSGGAVTRTTVDVGRSSGTGILNVSSGSLTTSAEIWLGSNATSAGFGVMNISGGTVSTGSWLALGRGAAAGTQDTRGVLNMSNGTLNVGSGGSFSIGAYQVATTATSLVSLSGGTMNVNRTVFVGENARGILDISGGNLNVGSAGVGDGVQIKNTLNLRGGTLSTNFVSNRAGGTSILNFNGGTLKAQIDSTTFLQGLAQANVFSGGATIDTNGKNITVAQALLAATGDGVSSVSVTNGGSGYASAPIVDITGGGGSGATAVATIDGNGVVTGITITNPGTGYTSAPTFSFGGGGGTGATPGTASLAANTSGGLTKTGAGTLTLTGTNTYTGGTKVNAGSLVIGSGGSLAATAVTVGGATATGTPTLGGIGTIGGATTISAANGGVVGIHSPGIAGVSGGVGTQAFSSDLTYGNGSIFEWDLNAHSTSTGFDKVTVGGNVSVGTGSTFKINLGSTVFTSGDFTDAVFWKTPYGTQTWNMSDIFSKAFSSGAFANVTTVQDVSTYGSFSITDSTLTWSAVPEPTSALVGLLIGAGLLRRRRVA